MNTTNRSNEVLLDFSCLFWDFITQWKAVLVFSLIISLLITGFKYKRDSAAYEAAVLTANENKLTSEQLNQKIRDSLDTLSDEDKAAVNYAIGFHSLIADKQTYQNESPIMKADPNHVDIISLGFQVTGNFDNLSISALDNEYLTLFDDASILEDVSNATATKISPDYIRELIYYYDPSKDLSKTTDSIIQDDNTFNIYMIIPPGEDSEAIQNAVIKSIKNKCHELSKTIAPHNINVISNSSSTTACNGVMARQSDVYYSLSYLKNSLNSVIAEFNSQQAAVYNTVLHLQSVIDAKNATESKDSIASPIEPGIGKKASIFGFCLGIILYFFIFIIYTVLRERIASSKIAKKILHQRLIGECYYKQPDITFLQKLFHSTCVFNYRFRNKTDFEEQVAAITQILGVISARENISNISIIDTSSGQGKIADSIVAKGKDDGVSMNIVKDANAIDDNALKDVTNAVISVSNNTCVKQLYSLIDLLDYYRIHVLGFIYTADY